jgi:hypothetical protein
MMVRIKLQLGRPIQRKSGKNRRLASAIGTLLIPVALMAYVMGFWRLASDMDMAGAFVVTGIFSHWQVWFTIAVAISLASSSLNRYGRGGDLNIPRVLMFRLFPDREVSSSKVRLR